MGAAPAAPAAPVEEPTRVVGAPVYEPKADPIQPVSEPTRVLDACCPRTAFRRCCGRRGTRVIPTRRPAPVRQPAPVEEDEEYEDNRDSVAEALIRWVPPITAILCAAIALCGFVYYQSCCKIRDHPRRGQRAFSAFCVHCTERGNTMPEQALQVAFEIKTACDEISRRLLRWHWERKPGAHSLDALLEHIAARKQESPDYYDRMPDLTGKTSWQQLDTTLCMRVLLDPENDAAARWTCWATRRTPLPPAMPATPSAPPATKLLTRQLQRTAHRQPAVQRSH